MVDSLCCRCEFRCKICYFGAGHSSVIDSDTCKISIKGIFSILSSADIEIIIPCVYSLGFACRKLTVIIYFGR